MRKVPEDIATLWCEGSNDHIDSVQHLAFRSSRPFEWRYRRGGETVLNPLLSEAHSPIVAYVHDTRITCGMTVPVHSPNGDCATVTGVRHDADANFDRDAHQYPAGFLRLAHALHASIEPMFGVNERLARAVRPTPRERECVRYSADGVSAKEISLKLARSTPPFVLHLDAAARELGACNRAQLVARAAHDRLLR
jgi:LuxR family transcriptional regulator